MDDFLPEFLGWSYQSCVNVFLGFHWRTYESSVSGLFPSSTNVLSIRVTRTALSFFCGRPLFRSSRRAFISELHRRPIQSSLDGLSLEFHGRTHQSSVFFEVRLTAFFPVYIKRSHDKDAYRCSVEFDWLPYSICFYLRISESLFTMGH